MIPENKIAVVTGDPRSGTSLMMQTLIHLGVPVAGDKFPADKRNQKRLAKIEEIEDQDEKEKIKKEIEDKKKEMIDKNPGGFYEIPGVVMKGLQAIGKHGGKAIKIISPGAWYHTGGRGMTGTPKDLVYKYIICVRDPRPVAVSQSKLSSNVSVAGKDGKWESPTWVINATRYMIENGMLAKYISELNEDDRTLWLPIDYDAYLDDPATTIDKIIKHLELNVTLEQRTAAINNIDPSLRRSDKEYDGWPDQAKANGVIAEEVYDCLKTLDPKSIEPITAKIENRMHLEQLENARWYDLETGLLLPASLYRDLQTPEKAENKAKLVTMFIRELKGGLHPMTDLGFSEPIDAEEYTINRPYDLGDLTRKMVQYRDDVITWEAAFTVHQQNWSKGKATRSKEKLAAFLKGM